MPAALPPEAAGFGALVALLLLPGVLLVRAPWTVAPALSAAFWILGWWWAPLGARSRLLVAALVLSALLAVLRVLPKHFVSPPADYTGPEPPPPVSGPTTGAAPPFRSAPSQVVVGVGLALLVPLPLWPHAAGREMAFHTTAARLAAWRDALPASYEPLLPLPHFGAHAPAFPTLAADLSLLTGLDPGRSVVLATLGSAALLLLALYALLATRLRPESAALGALLGLAAAPWPHFLAPWGEAGPVLALAFGLSAAALLLGHTSQPSAVAAGMLLGAALLAQPVLALVVAVAASAGSVLLPKRNARPRAGPKPLRRVAWACGVALVLAAPALVRLAAAVSASEVAEALAAIRVTEVASFVTGLAFLGLAAALARLLTDARLRSRFWTGALVAVSAGIVAVSVHLAPAAGQLRAEELLALARLESEDRPLEAVCAPAGLVDWVPALAGRAPGRGGGEAPEPWVPPPLRDEWAQAGPRSCSKALDPSGWRR